MGRTDVEPGSGGVLHQAVAIAAKDLEIEWRSRVALARIVPFAGVLTLLFAIALDPDRGLLPRVAPGLFWVSVLLCGLLALGRSFAIERENGAGQGLLMSGTDPAALYLGKVTALTVQLMVLEVVLGVVMVAVYDVTVHGLLLAAVAAVLATIGIAAAGTLYGAFVGLDHSRDSLLAILLLPVLVPVLLGATEVFESATAGATDGDVAWLGLLAAFAALYGGMGVLSFPSLFEEG